MWKWIIYTIIIIAVIAALVVAIIYAPKFNSCGCTDNCCGSPESVQLEKYVEEFDNHMDYPPRKYIGHRYDRDHDRKPTQYLQMGH